MIFSQFGKPTLVNIEISSFGGLCHTVIWSIWREQNARCFEGSEWFIHEIKSLLHSLPDWSISLYSLPCSSLLDLIEFRNLSG